MCTIYPKGQRFHLVIAFSFTLLLDKNCKTVHWWLRITTQSFNLFFFVNFMEAMLFLRYTQQKTVDSKRLQDAYQL